MRFSIATGENLRDYEVMGLPIEMPAELEDALGRPVPEAELRLWAALKPAERPKAVERAVALTKWHDDRGNWTAADAAREAGVAKNRFYALSSAWEDEARRSLAVLGVGAEAPRKRHSGFDDDLIDALRSRAKALVAREGADDVSISAMATELAEIIPRDIARKPGTSVLRAMLVEARQFHRMHVAIGTDIGFDLCACQLSGGQGQPYVLFVCIDRGTGFVLAYAFGDPANSLSQHRDLAAEVLRKWGPDSDARLPWAVKTERVEMVVGLDRVPFRTWGEAVRKRLSAKGNANLQPSITPRRFGRYLRKHFGAAVGRIRLLPASTRDPAQATSAKILTKERYSQEEALARIGLEIADHNDVILHRLGETREMPELIGELFGEIASR